MSENKLRKLEEIKIHHEILVLKKNIAVIFSSKVNKLYFLFIIIEYHGEIKGERGGY